MDDSSDIPSHCASTTNLSKELRVEDWLGLGVVTWPAVDFSGTALQDVNEWAIDPSDGKKLECAIVLSCREVAESLGWRYR